jgi:chaperonin GroES
MRRGIIAGQDGTIVSIKPLQSFTKYPFIPSPDAAFYDIGFGTLLGHARRHDQHHLNQIMDAGTLANMGGGWIGEGVSIKSGTSPARPGEWKKAGVNGGTLKDNIVPNPTFRSRRASSTS